MRTIKLVALAGICGLAALLTPALANSTGTVHTRVWASGKALFHGKKKAALSGPDDIAALGGSVYVAFQNGVGSKGEPSPTGNKASTIVKFSSKGKHLGQWDLTGKVDGMGAVSSLGAVLASVNEDGNSSLYELTSAGKLTHFTYSPAKLPSGGGTDAITAIGKLILISGSAPAGPTGPAVYKLTLVPKTHTAKLSAVFADDAMATLLNTSGTSKGTTTRLNLTDPDSSTLVPASIPRFGGDFMLNSQGDQQLIFVAGAGTSKQALDALNIDQSVDDVAWPTSTKGSLLSTDSSADQIVAISGFAAGSAYTAITPCNANSAPSTCSTPNSLGVIDTTTGKVAAQPSSGVAVQPKGMLYVP
jgi:hypothetical protein